MNNKFENSELDPSRMPVTEQSKDSFYFLIDELTEKAENSDAALGIYRHEQYDLEGGRKLYLTVYDYDPASSGHPDDEMAQAIIDTLVREANNKISRHRVHWVLFRNRRFEKLAEQWEMTDQGMTRKKILDARVSEEAARELGITVASESEAQEIIEILKTVKEHQKNR